MSKVGCDKMTLKEKLIDFMMDDPKTLESIYNEFPDTKPSTLRGRLNENVGKAFHRISKGIYVARRGDATAVIIEGDAWEKIKDIESNSVDTIITDSPYSCLDKHYQVGSTRQRNLNKSVGFKTQDIDKELLMQMKRILKDGGHLFSFLPPDSADTLNYNNHFIQIAQDEGLVFNKRWIWDKQVIGMGYNGRNRYEQIVFLSKGKRRMPYDLSIPDVLSHKRIAAHNRIHDAEKPIDLILDILKFSNQKGDFVVDMFAGSLVLAEAGLQRGVNTLCIELDGAMIEKAIQRRGLEC